MALPRLYTPEDVAEALRGVSPGWVREQARKRRCEAIKIAGAWRFTEGQYDELVRSHTVSAAPQQQTITRRTARTAPDSPSVVQLQARTPRRRIS